MQKSFQSEWAKLFSFHQGTIFGRALPIGGFVKFLGEDETNDDPEPSTMPNCGKDCSRSFRPIMNFLLAILLLTGFYMAFGVYEIAPDILEVAENSPAEKAGLMPGDRIVQIDDTPIDLSDNEKAVESIRTLIKEKGKNALSITVDRDGKDVIMELVPQYNAETDSYMIGIVFGRLKRFSLFPALGTAFTQTGRILVLMADMLRGLIFRGQGINELMGPVGIVGEIGKAVQAGVQQVLSLAILITLNLGIMNLIPFPALDGGRLVMLVFEGVRGKPMEPEKEGFIHFIGFVVLMLLMVMVTYKDLLR